MTTWSVKVLVIDSLASKRYPSTSCLMQGSCDMCNNVSKILTSNLACQPLLQCVLWLC